MSTKDLLQLAPFSEAERQLALGLWEYLKPKDIADDPLPFAAAWLLYRARQGATCLEAAAPPLWPEDWPCAPNWPDLNEWMRLAKAGHPLLGGHGEFKPVILEHGRLYLQRFQALEKSLASGIEAMATTTAPSPAALELLRELCASTSASDQQKLAVFGALRRRFAVITGGPGTGKTTCVLNLILARLHDNRGLNIALAAPTGKAAARINESLAQGIARLRNQPIPGLDPGLMDLIPLDARTLHKRLGISASTPSGNRHSQGHLSTADLVVVDEASMVPLPLMALLVAQLAPHASLVLLGDRDQLTSVDLGSVLGDLVEAASGLPYSRNFATGAAALGVAVPDVAPQADGPLTDAVHRLIHTHRFKTTDTIGRFCLALQENKPHEAVNALIVSGCLAPPPGPLSGARPSVSIAEIVSAAVSGHYASLASIRDPAEALTTLNSFRLLTSHRIGAYGVEAINRLACLAVGHHPGELFHGLPILVTRNAPELDLWNGDCGVLLRNPASGVLEAWFHGLPGCPPRSFGPAILPEWEPAYAMSIHKSQGSEFAAVTIVLPPEDSPILTRELLYTGASRARERLTVHADEQLLALALSRTVARPSGLVERLRSCSLQIHQ